MIRYLLVMAMIILTPPKGNGGMPHAPRPAVVEARVWDKLAAALSFVESRNDDRAYNATSGALGRWQMKRIYVDEVNRMGFLGVLVMRNSMFASQYLFMRQHEISRKDLPCTLLK